MKRKYSKYEAFIRERAAYYGYSSLTALAAAMGMSLQTLTNRIRGISNWTVDEAYKLQDVLKLSEYEMLVLVFYRVSPNDCEYPGLINWLFDRLIAEMRIVDQWDYF